MPYNKQHPLSTQLCLALLAAGFCTAAGCGTSSPTALQQAPPPILGTAAAPEITRIAGPPDSVTPAIAPPTTATSAPQLPHATISGIVVQGGESTPAGIADTTRQFAYEVKADDGTRIWVTYIAYPPSPFGDRQRAKIRLNFHAGKILIGDYLIAHGTIDQSANIVSIAEQGDYIETYSDKPQ